MNMVKTHYIIKTTPSGEWYKTSMIRNSYEDAERELKAGRFEYRVLSIESVFEDNSLKLSLVSRFKSCRLQAILWSTCTLFALIAAVLGNKLMFVNVFIDSGIVALNLYTMVSLKRSLTEVERTCKKII